MWGFVAERLRVLLSALLIAAALYLLPPPWGPPVAVLLSGGLLGASRASPRSSFLLGLEAGLAGYLIAYLLSGGGELGIRVHLELLGAAGVALPLLYYSLGTGAAAYLLSSLRRGSS
ncbi:MAG: hypothetical protein N3F67_03270 [Acidilobaceae archaeon]|nr:hypothetical protein [Acidilobaceae archaeon]